MLTSLLMFMFIFKFFFFLPIFLQTPRFWMFVIVPGILFIIDKIISLQTKFMELDILETELLPSGKLLVQIPFSFLFPK